MPNSHTDITCEKINELCDIILVYEDDLNFEKAKKYIENHIRENVIFSGDLYDIRSYVQSKVESYLDNIGSDAPAFSFAGDNRFHKYRKQFKDYYYQYYNDLIRTEDDERSSLVYPAEFGYVFDAIQEYINYHTIYYNLTIKIIEDVKTHTTNEVSKAVQTAAEQATQAADNASAAQMNAIIAAKKAKNAANKATEEAIDQIIKDKKLDKRIEDNIDGQMIKVTSKISETSVTILGIFAGIVLAVVAGLFYSSSVLENINNASPSKLLLVSSLVGLVCLNILAVMFFYIEKFRRSPEKNDTSLKIKWKTFWSELPKRALDHLTIVIIDFILVMVMFFSGINCAISYKNAKKENDAIGPNTNISVDVNDSKDNQTDETNPVNDGTNAEESEVNTSDDTSSTTAESVN